ncbi:MAG TPA: response regulator transcription factor [Nocardioides sp.]|jgi:two-component system, NarL family, response regulator LiaR|nr:response regulator transcription factor [Nocardioides sp.]
MATPVGTPPIRVAIVNDYELVVAGLAAALAPYADQVAVVELEAGSPVLRDVDVVLYDMFGRAKGDVAELEKLVRDSGVKIAAFSWNVQPELVARTLARGAAGYLSKGLSAEELVRAIRAVHAGEVVVPPGVDASDVLLATEWPGHDACLSTREAEVLTLITQGYSNREIAERAYLSINSVKTYIRATYRKIGVTRRPQAVVWGLTHGFANQHDDSAGD